MVSCSPEAPWTTDEVNVSIKVKTTSAGFIECNFSTDKEAYYMIDCIPVVDSINPMEFQKQFMMLALDSLQVDYLAWRHELLKQGEFTVAPISSHSLQYGDVTHFFTDLMPDTDYWVYAFVVDPNTLKPAGKLSLQTIRTDTVSAVDIHFEYRVRGYWDYIYPVDTASNIYSRYPYMATTRDSAELSDSLGITGDIATILYFSLYYSMMSPEHVSDSLIYGVKAVNNIGGDSYLTFEEDHTYYTAIVAWDGGMGNHAIYKFKWTGPDFKAYYKDTDANNIVNNQEDE